MRRDPRAFLWDVREAALAIQGFVTGLNAFSYATNELVQAAVERKFEIMGEALNQLAKADPTVAARVSDLSQIIAFRNQLIHGYAHVNVGTVWNVVTDSLPGLLDCVQGILDELDDG